MPAIVLLPLAFTAAAVLSNRVDPVFSVLRNAVLADRDGLDAAEIGGELRVGRRHQVADNLHELAHHRLLGAEQAGRAHDATQQAAQHVAAAVVAGVDAVGDQHGAGARVVGDHPEPHVVLVRDAVGPAGQLLGLVDDRAEQVGLVDVVDALQQERDALDAHAGVDVLLRQRAEDLEVVLAGARAALVLHEHEVPDFDVAVLVGLRAALDAVFGAAVVVDLRARAARAWDAHRPVVVGHAAPLDPLGRDTHLEPDPLGLIVIEVDGGPEALRIEAVAAVLDAVGQQRPGEGDRLALEVVAEAEVARHLEEGVVPGGDADVLDVTGAHALLHAGRGRVRRGLLTEEERHELDHSCVDEQQVRVGQDQRGTRYLGMPGTDEMVQEAPSNLVGLHRYPAYRCGARAFSSTRGGVDHRAISRRPGRLSSREPRA